MTVREVNNGHSPTSFPTMGCGRVEYKTDATPRRTIMLLHGKSHKTVDSKMRNNRRERTFVVLKVKLISWNLPASVTYVHAYLSRIYPVFVSKRHTSFRILSAFVK